MHLKSLTLKGFKSFASATTLKFEPGICAVVGPNGSGKSNIVDALTWVMGEQGAKNLRGGKMEDVIFAGAGDRKPLGRAEVTLTIDNQDGALDIEYSEVSITRRMFRDGASEYEINGSKARLMDIQELLSDSGIGREMHIIVGQNKLGDILASRPEERRAYIEEAAGVLKHRRRKEKAQRKLTGMQANLDRLQDLNDELSKQLGPLARQAETAKRAATVQADLRQARLSLAGDRVTRLRKELHDAESRARLTAEKVAAVTETLEEATERQLEVEEQLAELNPASEEAQQLWFRLSTLAERISAIIRIAAERAANAGEITAYRGQNPDELERRAELADEEYSALEEAAEEAAERLEEIREEVLKRKEAFETAEAGHLAAVRAIADRREGVVRLLASEESLQAKVAAAEAEIERLDDEVARTRTRARGADDEAREVSDTLADLERNRAPLDEAHVRASAEADAAEKRLDQLRDQQRARERVVYSLIARIETLTESAPKAAAADVLGDVRPLAETLKADEDVATALAAALGTFAEALVGATGDDVLEKLGGAERTALISEATGEQWRMESALPAGATWLLDSVTSDLVAVNRLLADVVLVDDESAARAVIVEDPRLRAVTRGGELFGEGWVVAGVGQATAVVTAAQVDTARGELERAQAELEELSGTLEGARQAAEEARVAAAGATASLREHDTQIQSWKRDYQRLASQLEANKKEHQRAAERATAAEVRAVEARKELDEVRDRLARVQEDGADEPQEASTAERDATQAALNQVRSMEMEANLQLRTATERASQQAGRGDGLRRQAAAERENLVRHERAMAQRKAAGELARAVEKHARDLASRTSDALERASAQRDELVARRAAVSGQLQQVKSEVSAARTQLDRLTDSAHAADIAEEQIKVRIEESESKIVEQLGISIEDILKDFTPDEGFDRAAVEKQLTRAEKDLRALGKVNPLALEEYKALEERFEFLSTQLADVKKARTDLEGVIEDVDARILKLFTDAWHDVEQEFPKVFQTLFPGGEGRLLLTDPDDMLTAGIEVEARPPGKRVKRLSLLSGGEKSLTALAMLVAIFRARPSPFYVMDEVEAALDDVNLRRLIALFEELRKDSQLIVITHQKPTMDIANVLYGVTMRGDGVTRVLSQRMNPAGQAPDSGKVELKA